jgi:hypothetical protein
MTLVRLSELQSGAACEVGKTRLQSVNAHSDVRCAPGVPVIVRVMFGHCVSLGPFGVTGAPLFLKQFHNHDLHFHAHFTLNSEWHLLEPDKSDRADDRDCVSQG